MLPFLVICKHQDFCSLPRVLVIHPSYWSLVPKTGTFIPENRPSVPGIGNLVPRIYFYIERTKTYY